jgi:hypothetical protein
VSACRAAGAWRGGEAPPETAASSNAAVSAAAPPSRRNANRRDGGAGDSEGEAARRTRRRSSYEGREARGRGPQRARGLGGASFHEAEEISDEERLAAERARRSSSCDRGAWGDGRYREEKDARRTDGGFRKKTRPGEAVSSRGASAPSRPARAGKREVRNTGAKPIRRRGRTASRFPRLFNPRVLFFKQATCRTSDSSNKHRR